MTLTEIQDATKNDPTLCEVIHLIKNNSWQSQQDIAGGVDVAALKAFNKIKDELTVTATNGVLRGTKIVIPSSLQVRAISLAHQNKEADQRKTLVPWY